jgi:hypothetical protein
MPKSKKTSHLKLPDNPLGNRTKSFKKHFKNYILFPFFFLDNILRRNLYLAKYARANDLQHHLGKFIYPLFHRMLN